MAKAKEEVLKRYERLIENYAKADSMEIQEIYLNTLSRLYDPHSAFLSEYYLEEFDHFSQKFACRHRRASSR